VAEREILMPTTRDTAKLLDLQKRIDRLSAADQLRVCAALLDEGGAGNYAIAETLVGRVVDALRAVRLLHPNG
jgi:hypothetical protein